MPKLDSIEVNISIPLFGSIKGKWTPKDDERKAAWELYVELITRISVVHLEKEEGYLREALNSLYSIFTTTRNILRKYGPKVAQQKDSSELSFGKIAILVLNYQLRPLLSKWHTELKDYEDKKDPSIPSAQYEAEWELNKEMRSELEITQSVLLEYADILGKVANVELLHRIVGESK